MAAVDAKSGVSRALEAMILLNRAVGNADPQNVQIVTTPTGPAVVQGGSSGVLFVNVTDAAGRSLVTTGSGQTQFTIGGQGFPMPLSLLATIIAPPPVTGTWQSNLKASSQKKLREGKDTVTGHLKRMNSVVPTNTEEQSIKTVYSDFLTTFQNELGNSSVIDTKIGNEIKLLGTSGKSAATIILQKAYEELFAASIREALKATAEITRRQCPTPAVSTALGGGSSASGAVPLASGGSSAVVAPALPSGGLIAGATPAAGAGRNSRAGSVNLTAGSAPASSVASGLGGLASASASPAAIPAGSLGIGYAENAPAVRRESANLLALPTAGIPLRLPAAAPLAAGRAGGNASAPASPAAAPLAAGSAPATPVGSGRGGAGNRPGRPLIEVIGEEPAANGSSRRSSTASSLANGGLFNVEGGARRTTRRRRNPRRKTRRYQ